MLALQACQAEYYLTTELRRTLYQQLLSKSMISPISPFQLLVVFALVMVLTAKSQARLLSQSPSTRITLKVTLYVVDLSPAMEVVLGEPWLRQTSAHLEYGPTGMSCVHVWKGSRRMSLKPQVAQDKPKQLLLSAM